ncbi:MAG: ABC transporter substrate-binding protein [Rhodospirillales bacterium]|nr:ABC transporter substrate-binding protein [Rhodospirillales bacterium]MBT4040679.1 ABC transporter substrate-binding protein [Rhodospirillales bacterium]MBT4626300.1 ABC transporter substrate-binding protein [Rhodospirillales bacterium]MBT5520510.1 ABC transporter substrate-binding protein [Rhodospirillales bacterium]MBT6110186.1 ABC transporter substrate-binding protein [Rhodospirillales bacterium]
MVKLTHIGAAVVAAALVVGISAVPVQAETLTLVSWGGKMQEANRKAHWGPATEALGIDYVEDTLSNGYADIKVQVEAGAVTWDIVQGGAGEAMRGGADGNVEPIDYSVIDVTHVPENLRNDYCVGMLTYSTMMAYNTDTYGNNGPKTWADFWDVDKFPGARSMRARPAGNLEFALIADGVPMDKVYDVLSSDGGIERALDKMREIVPHVAVWWSSGAHHAQLMKDGEVDMSTGWNGRFSGAIDDGANAALNFNQGQIAFDCYYVPKGAPNKDMAMKLIGEMTKPIYQANLTKYIAYGPTNMEAFEIGVITPEVAASLPSSPANAKIQFVNDAEWWRINGARAEEMFDEMMTE